MIFQPSAIHMHSKRETNYYLLDRQKCFQKITFSKKLCFTGDSHCHKLMVTCVYSHFTQIQSQTIIYRNFNNFNKHSFQQLEEEYNNSIIFTYFFYEKLSKSFQNLAVDAENERNENQSYHKFRPKQGTMKRS